MKTSEVVMTSTYYRLSPNAWGDETIIMINEAACTEMMEKAFGYTSDPDDDPNDRPEEVEIATAYGKFYAVKEDMWPGQYRRQLYCQIDSDPGAEDCEFCNFLGNWKEFDDEDED